ncbi:MAG: PDZ domain-containing protein [Saprospiraceae bacterium]|nr:PDZ domain-containing protein [Saprospiraceae bacterium]
MNFFHHIQKLRSIWMCGLICLLSGFVLAAPIKIPFRYVQSFILIELKVNSKIPVQLIFDTGAEHHILFDRIYTDLFENIYTRQVKVIGSDFQQELNALITKPLTNVIPAFGELTFPWLVLEDANQALSEWVGENVQGILSANCFSNYILEIDYRRQQIILHEKLPKKINKSYTVCSNSIQKNKPYIQTMVQSTSSVKPIPMELLLDTGAGVPLLIYAYEKDILTMPQPLIPGYLGSGLGGKINGLVGRIDQFQFCNQTQTLVPTYFHIIDSIQLSLDPSQKKGIIGNQILEKYSIFLDYRNQKLYLKLKSTKNKIIQFDRSGILVVSGGPMLKNYYVSMVIPGSPAEEAGIEIGDEIVSLKGLGKSFLSLHYIQKILSSKKLDKVKIKLLRNNVKIKRNIRLRELI